MIFCDPPECPSCFYLLLSHVTLECIICHKRATIKIKDNKIVIVGDHEVKKDYHTVSDDSIELLLNQCGYEKIKEKTS